MYPDSVFLHQYGIRVHVLCFDCTVPEQKIDPNAYICFSPFCRYLSFPLISRSRLYRGRVVRGSFHQLKMSTSFVGRWVCINTPHSVDNESFHLLIFVEPFTLLAVCHFNAVFNSHYFMFLIRLSTQRNRPKKRQSTKILDG